MNTQLIEQFLQVFDLERSTEQALISAKAHMNLTPEDAAKIDANCTKEMILEDLRGIMAEVFEEEEMEALVAFYLTPAGKGILSKWWVTTNMVTPATSRRIYAALT